MATHYLFGRNSSPAGRWIEGLRGDNVPRVDWYYWRKGSFIPKTEIIPNPIKFTLEPHHEGVWDCGLYMPSYFYADAPLFSDALIKALKECAVDNLELHDVAILWSNKLGRNYSL